MKTLKVLIVEDELIIANDIAAHLQDLGLDICEIQTSGEEALQYLQAHQADFVLMDIVLSGSLDGIDTARIIQERFDLSIIYMTANTDGLTFERAKSTKPFAFIEKPFKKRRLVRTVELLIERLLEKGENPESSGYVLNDRVFIRNKGALIKTNIKDILYMEAERAYCKIVTNDQTFIISTSLGTIEKKFNAAFLKRVHRSYTVNIEKIDQIKEHMIYIGQAQIPVSRSHWDDLTQSLQIM